MQIITVQDTFVDVIQDVEDGTVDQENFWVSRRSSEEAEQELFYINVAKEEDQVKFTNQEGVVFIQFLLKNRRRFKLQIGDESYDLQASQSWHKFDSVMSLASTTNKLIMGTIKGTYLVYDLRTQKIVKEVKGAHEANIEHIRVFPSQQVILTVGLDLQMKIWLLKNDSQIPAQVLKGHTLEITSIEFIGNGRNYLTGSLDGAVNLWECGSGSLVYSFRRIDNLQDPVNCIATAKLPKPWSITEPLTDKEFDTVGRELYVGYESGIIQSFDVGYHSQLRKRLVRFEGVAVTSMVISGKYLIAGYGNGHLLVWEQETIKIDVSLSPHRIAHLAVLDETEKRVKLLVTNGADLVLNVHIDVENGTQSITYMVGVPEVFTATSVSYNGSHVFVSDKSGVGVFQVAETATGSDKVIS
jgi:proteasomal ATPase-associated factor 1